MRPDIFCRKKYSRCEIDEIIFRRPGREYDKDCKRIKKYLEKKNLSKVDFAEHLWHKSWIYIRTMVDVLREPVLILDKDLKVMMANESFYRVFQVERIDTENKIIEVDLIEGFIDNIL